MYRWQESSIDTGMFQVGQMPAMLRDIVQTALRRPVLLERVLACKLVDDEVIGPAEMRGAFDDLRFMPLKPAPLSVDALLVGYAARNAEKFVRVNRRSQLFDLGDSARIVLLDTATKRPAGRIQYDHGRH